MDIIDRRINYSLEVTNDEVIVNAPQEWSKGDIDHPGKCVASEPFVH